jgi:hypothetical protein
LDRARRGRAKLDATAQPFSSSAGDGEQVVDVFSDEKRDNDVVSLELLHI